jgi:hypothetical protein
MESWIGDGDSVEILILVVMIVESLNTHFGIQFV